MFILSESVQVYVFSKAVDMRKSINGLSQLVSEETSLLLQSQALFVFYNKSRDKIKALYWHRNGFVLLYKRLEQGRFKISRGKNETYVTIEKDEYDWLMSGLDYELMHQFPENNYEHDA